MSTQDPLRHIPVRPNLQQLKVQAKDFLRAIQRGETEAITEFAESHPEAARIQT